MAHDLKVRTLAEIEADVMARYRLRNDAPLSEAGRRILHAAAQMQLLGETLRSFEERGVVKYPLPSARRR